LSKNGTCTTGFITNFNLLVYVVIRYVNYVSTALLYAGRSQHSAVEESDLKALVTALPKLNTEVTVVSQNSR